MPLSTLIPAAVFTLKTARNLLHDTQIDNFDTAEQCQAFEDGSAFDVKEKPKEKYQAQDIYQSHDQSSHNADESSDGVIDGTFKEVDE